MAAEYRGIVQWVWNRVNHFDYNKYWKMREYICKNRGRLKAYYYLFRVKKIDSFHNASLGTHISFHCARIDSQPILLHGLNGIIISNDAHVGKECTIYHQVTIAGGNGGSPDVGDHVFVGAGAKIIGPVHIGNNAKIGAGCIVTIDVPDNATVVMNHPRIIIHDERKGSGETAGRQNSEGEEKTRENIDNR